mgnify:FL=1
MYIIYFIMGTYTLVLKNNKEFKKKIGSLGKILFKKGYYTYTGSVTENNFSRTERHRNICNGEKDTEHWHIDYILQSPTISIIDIFKTNKDKECEINNDIKFTEFNTIGASDCTNCESHVKYSDNLKQLAVNLKCVYKDN